MLRVTVLAALVAVIPNGPIWPISSAHAQVPAPQPIAKPVDMSTFDKNFADYVRSIVRVVSPGREIHQWHWMLKSEANITGPIGPRDDRVFKHLLDLRGTFDSAQGVGVVGPGYYTAGDPEVSKDFGTLQSGLATSPMDWVLIQTKIPRDVRFLDGVAGGRFPEILKDQIQEFGCQAVVFNTPGQPPFPRSAGRLDRIESIFNQAETLPFPQQPGVPIQPVDPAIAKCKILRDRAVDLTGTSAVRFNFGTSRLEGCPIAADKRMASNAFMMFKEDAMNLGSAVIFTRDLPATDDGHQQNRLMIQDLFVRSGHPFGPWPELWGLKTSVDMVKFMRTNIMACVPEGVDGHFKEDDDVKEVP